MNKDIIRVLREKAGITQLQLANALDVDRSTVAKWEIGKSAPKTSMISNLAKALNCEIKDLF